MSTPGGSGGGSSNAAEPMQSDQPAANNPGNIGTSAVLGAGGGLRSAERVTIVKQRTYKHYLTYDAHKNWQYTNVPESEKVIHGDGKCYINQDWKYLPYQWFHSYMNAREYQAMNVEHKRWRIKQVQVTGHHIIPFVDDLKGVAGNVTPSVEISPLNFFEAFVDVHGELPQINVNASDLPNYNMSSPFCTRSKSKLKRVLLAYTNYEGGEAESFLSLEQSPSFQFVDAMEGFEFTHTIHPVDQQWRHALFPINQSYHQYKANYSQDDQYLAPIVGRTNNMSGTCIAKNLNENKNLLPGVPGDNLMMESWLPHYPHHPPPKILFRVPEVQRASDSGCPYGFVMHVTYRMVIEAEPNYVSCLPIKFSAPTPGKLFTGERESFQASGGDAHGMMIIGNKNNQYNPIVKSFNDVN